MTLGIESESGFSPPAQVAAERTSGASQPAAVSARRRRLEQSRSAPDAAPTGTSGSASAAGVATHATSEINTDTALDVASVRIYMNGTMEALGDDGPIHTLTQAVHVAWPNVKPRMRADARVTVGNFAIGFRPLTGPQIDALEALTPWFNWPPVSR